MKKIFVFALAVLFAVGCYDDSKLWESVNDHEDRIVELESLCNEMNTNILSLQTIVNASQSGDYIKDITPVMEGGKEVGFTITFAKAEKITIYHGKDGRDGEPGKDGQDGAPGKDGADTGAAPEIGIKQGEDNIHYWTLNGEWLLADDGNRIKAVGVDGKDGKPGAEGRPGADGQPGNDGITPQLKIEEDYWFVSYDGGNTWNRLGKAVGENGAAGGDSIFSNVYEQGGYVYFLLANGDSYKIPTEGSTALDIVFDVEQNVAVVPESTLKVKYTITGAKGKTYVRISATGEVGDLAAVKPSDDGTGYIYIRMWNWFDGQDDPERDEPYWDKAYGDVTEEDVFNSTLCVLVVVTDSEGNQAIKALNFVEGVLDSIQDAYITDAVAGSVSVTIKTNVIKGSYKAVIPEKAQGWLSYAPTKAEMREDVLNFTVRANDGDKFRSAPIKLVNEMNQVLENFVIVQRSSIAGEIMTFADSRVKTVCVGRFDKNLDGELTYEEVATVTDVKDLFLLEKNIVSFDEFEYFSSVTEIPDNLFENCKNLVSVKLPESVTRIGHSAFSDCISLKSIVIPEGVANDDSEFGGSGWFNGCSSLENVTLPSTLKSLPAAGFQDCVSLRTITIPEGIDVIMPGCFWGCSALSQINYTTPIKYVGSGAFIGCVALKSFDFSSLEGIGESAFSCTGLTSVEIPETITQIPESVFAGCKDLASVKLHDDINYIGSDAFGMVTEYDDFGEKVTSCSSLKHIELPANLEYIGYNAFEGSAIEGQDISGTSMKALVIPAKVTHIGDDAFRNCPAISAVKMLPMWPANYDNYVEAFDRYTTIYVHEDALETYKSSGWAYNYTILPFDMMTVSLGLEFEMTGEPTFTDGFFHFPVSVNVTGDAAVLEYAAEFGYFTKPVGNDYYYDEGVVYYPVSTLNQSQTISLDVYSYYAAIDYESQKATAQYQLGAYIRMIDGTVVTYGKQAVDLLYDQKLSFEYVKHEITGTEASGSRNYVNFTVEYKVTGAYWLENLELNYDGTGSLSCNREFTREGNLIYTGHWQYYTDEENPSISVWLSYQDRYSGYETAAFELTGSSIAE